MKLFISVILVGLILLTLASGKAVVRIGDDIDSGSGNVSISNYYYNSTANNTYFWQGYIPSTFLTWLGDYFYNKSEVYNKTEIDSHYTNTSNPHNTTLQQAFSRYNYPSLTLNKTYRNLTIALPGLHSGLPAGQYTTCFNILNRTNGTTFSVCDNSSNSITLQSAYDNGDGIITNPSTSLKNLTFNVAGGVNLNCFKLQRASDDVLRACSGGTVIDTPAGIETTTWFPMSDNNYDLGGFFGASGYRLWRDYYFKGDILGYNSSTNGMIKRLIVNISASNGNINTTGNIYAQNGTFDNITATRVTANLSGSFGYSLQDAYSNGNSIFVGGYPLNTKRLNITLNSSASNSLFVIYNRTGGVLFQVTGGGVLSGSGIDSLPKLTLQEAYNEGLGGLGNNITVQNSLVFNLNGTINFTDQNCPSSFKINQGSTTVLKVDEYSSQCAFTDGAPPGIEVASYFPISDNTYDLGGGWGVSSPVIRNWRDIYMKGTIYGGLEVSESPSLAHLAINASSGNIKTIGNINTTGNIYAQNYSSQGINGITASYNCTSYPNVTITGGLITSWAC